MYSQVSCYCGTKVNIACPWSCIVKMKIVKLCCPQWGEQLFKRTFANCDSVCQYRPLGLGVAWSSLHHSSRALERREWAGRGARRSDAPNCAELMLCTRHLLLSGIVITRYYAEKLYPAARVRVGLRTIALLPYISTTRRVQFSLDCEKLRLEDARTGELMYYSKCTW